MFVSIILSSPGGGLDDSVPHRLKDLNSWFPVGDTVCRCDVALLSVGGAGWEFTA